MQKKSTKTRLFSGAALPLLLAAGGAAIAMTSAVPYAEAALSAQDAAPQLNSAMPSPNPAAVKDGTTLAGCTPCNPCNPCNPCEPTGSCFDPEEGKSVPC